MSVNIEGLLASYVDCLDRAKAIVSKDTMGEDEATHVNCLSKVADQYLGALKLLWPHRPPSLDNELKAQAEQIAEKAFGLEKK